ncbi:hypothetical protein IE077_002266 [Cardiosporidium cionae]|uniref:Uncharacterized protein n=1 Tax=Cardiosporidium cionae TaxID=476202 RepID=A0ABQ7JBA5_9APIC|nr:hypothetical protein IE077_002266 [Cardiosporidium cionae]|eukprot:KAF8821239.1 hypothetical protein IE077_002266 [Cardiosporidium cionae]
MRRLSWLSPHLRGSQFKFESLSYRRFQFCISPRYEQDPVAISCQRVIIHPSNGYGRFEGMDSELINQSIRKLSTVERGNYTKKKDIPVEIEVFPFQLSKQAACDGGESGEDTQQMVHTIMDHTRESPSFYRTLRENLDVSCGKVIVNLNPSQTEQLVEWSKKTLACFAGIPARYSTLFYPSRDAVQYKHDGDPLDLYLGRFISENINENIAFICAPMLLSHLALSLFQSLSPSTLQSMPIDVFECCLRSYTLQLAMQVSALSTELLQLQFAMKAFDCLDNRLFYPDTDLLNVVSIFQKLKHVRLDSALSIYRVVLDKFLLKYYREIPVEELSKLVESLSDFSHLPFATQRDILQYMALQSLQNQSKTLLNSLIRMNILPFLTDASGSELQPVVLNLLQDSPLLHEVLPNDRIIEIMYESARMGLEGSPNDIPGLLLLLFVNIKILILRNSPLNQISPSDNPFRWVRDPLILSVVEACSTTQWIRNIRFRNINLDYRRVRSFPFPQTKDILQSRGIQSGKYKIWAYGRFYLDFLASCVSSFNRDMCEIIPLIYYGTYLHDKAGFSCRHYSSPSGIAFMWEGRIYIVFAMNLSGKHLSHDWGLSTAIPFYPPLLERLHSITQLLSKCETIEVSLHQDDVCLPLFCTLLRMLTECTQGSKSALISTQEERKIHTLMEEASGDATLTSSEGIKEGNAPLYVELPAQSLIPALSACLEQPILSSLFHTFSDSCTTSSPLPLATVLIYLRISDKIWKCLSRAEGRWVDSLQRLEASILAFSSSLLHAIGTSSVNMEASLSHLYGELSEQNQRLVETQQYESVKHCRSYSAILQHVKVAWALGWMDSSKDIHTAEKIKMALADILNHALLSQEEIWKWKNAKVLLQLAEFWNTSLYQHSTKVKLLLAEVTESMIENLDILNLQLYCKLSHSTRSLTMETMQKMQANLIATLEIRKLRHEEVIAIWHILEFLRLFRCVSPELLLHLLSFAQKALLSLENNANDPPLFRAILTILHTIVDVIDAPSLTTKLLSTDASIKDHKQLYMLQAMAKPIFIVATDILQRNPHVLKKASFLDITRLVWVFSLWDFRESHLFEYSMALLCNQLKSEPILAWPLSFLYEISLVLPPDGNERFLTVYKSKLEKDSGKRSGVLRNHKNVIEHSYYFAEEFDKARIKMWENYMRQIYPNFYLDVSVGTSRYHLYKERLSNNLSAWFLLHLPSNWSSFDHNILLKSNSIFVNELERRAHKVHILDWRHFEKMNDVKMKVFLHHQRLRN